MSTCASNYVDVDGIRTHYLEAGEGPVVVLLHSGEYGACAEISWEYNLDALAKHFRVVAPDWLGYGRTDKVYRFNDARAFVYRHLERFLQLLCIEKADFIGNSMGGTNLIGIAASQPEMLPIRSLIICGGGGFAPHNAHRQAMLDYNGSDEAMANLLNAMMHDSKWSEDADYIAKRQVFAKMPGAWENTSAARFKSPFAEARPEFGREDTTAYEQVAFPTLLIAGREDKLREPNYADAMAARIPNCELHVIEECGHCPNIERPEIVNPLMVDFLKRQHTG